MSAAEEEGQDERELGILAHGMEVRTWGKNVDGGGPRGTKPGTRIGVTRRIQ